MTKLKHLATDFLHSKRFSTTSAVWKKIGRIMPVREFNQERNLRWPQHNPGLLAWEREAFIDAYENEGERLGIENALSLMDRKINKMPYAERLAKREQVVEELLDSSDPLMKRAKLLYIQRHPELVDAETQEAWSTQAARSGKFARRELDKRDGISEPAGLRKFFTWARGNGFEPQR